MWGPFCGSFGPAGIYGGPNDLRDLSPYSVHNRGALSVDLLNDHGP